MENKQTAVEWLYENILTNPIGINEIEYNEETWVRAKIMEQEQIMDAFVDGEHQQGFENEAEQYYNETYGK